MEHSHPHGCDVPDRDASPVEYTHTQPFNGPLSGTTRVSRYQKGKTNLDALPAAQPTASKH